MRGQVCSKCGRYIERGQRTRLVNKKLVHLNCQSIEPTPKRDAKR